MSDEVALARIEERLAGVIHRLSGLETVLELRSETIERHNREALANAHDISTIKLSASKDGNAINKIKQLRGLFFFLRNHRLRQPCRNAYPHHIYHITTCINSPSHNLTMRCRCHKCRQHKPLKCRCNTEIGICVRNRVVQNNARNIDTNTLF